MSHLRRLAAALADAISADDVARAALTAAVDLPGVVRAGLAVNRTGGRQLEFVSSDDDTLTPTSVRWCLIDGYADVPLVDAVRSGTDVFLSEPSALAEEYPDIAERQHALGTRSMVALALATEQEQLGALMLSYRHPQEFDQETRWFLSTFATQVSQALRKGLAYQIQHTTSEQLQRSLMPRALPDLPGLALGAHYSAGGPNADVGGDWYDVLELPDGSTVCVLGDVMGKGVPAAIVMSEIRSALRAYAILDATPSVVLARLDTLVASHAVPEQLVTVAYALVSGDRRTLTLGVAGHPPPLLVPGGDPVRVLDDDIGPALGLSAGPWTDVVLDLAPDTTMLLYSDGLVETRDQDLFRGIDEVVGHIDKLAARRRRPRELCARLGSLMEQELADDDVTVLAVAVTEVGVTLSAATPLPANATAPSIARRFIRETLADWAAPVDLVERAELCTSELVTNAVIHSGTTAEITAHLDDEFLTVLVHDQGSRGSVQQSEEGEALRVSGRGLTLVDALASTWSAEQGADGTTVWFEMEREPAELDLAAE
jgi:serine phosphatase RsbU (regulator of sigma subunit)/anti-sigma regulatory factor (Ser/Thr protein kinase)